MHVNAQGFGDFGSFGELGDFGDPRQVRRSLRAAERRVPKMDAAYRLYGDPVAKGHNPFMRDLGHFAALMDAYSLAETGELPFGDQGFGEYVSAGMADAQSPGLAAFHGFEDGLGDPVEAAREDLALEYGLKPVVFNRKGEFADFQAAYYTVGARLRELGRERLEAYYGREQVGAYGDSWSRALESLRSVNAREEVNYKGYGDFGLSWKDLDPTRKNSKVRQAARAMDVTDKKSAVRSAARAVDVTNKNSAVRQGLRQIDFTDPDSGIRKLLTELDPTSSKSLLNKLLVKYGDYVLFPMGTMVKYGPEVARCEGTPKEKFECFMQVFLKVLKEQLKNLGPVLEVIGIVVCAFAQQWPMAALMATKFTLKQIILVIKNNKKAAKLVKVLQAMVDAGDLIIMIVAVGFMACLEAANFYSSVGKILVVLSPTVGEVIMYNSVLIAGAVKYGPVSDEVKKILNDTYIAPIKAAYFETKAAISGVMSKNDGAAQSLEAGGTALESFGEVFNSFGRSCEGVKALNKVGIHKVFFGLGKGMAGLKAKLDGFSKAIKEGGAGAAEKLRAGLLNAVENLEEKGKVGPLSLKSRAAAVAAAKPAAAVAKPPLAARPSVTAARPPAPKTEAQKIASKLSPALAKGTPVKKSGGLAALLGGAAGFVLGGPIGAVAGAAAGAAVGGKK